MKSTKDKEKILANLKRKIETLELDVKNIKRKHNISWLVIFAGILISMYALTQLDGYNWAWYFLGIYPLLSFFFISATHIDSDKVYELKRLKTELVDLEMKNIEI